MSAKSETKTANNSTVLKTLKLQKAQKKMLRKYQNEPHLQKSMLNRKQVRKANVICHQINRRQGKQTHEYEHKTNT